MSKAEERTATLPQFLPQDLAEARVGVFGLGRFGGGLGLVRFLAQRSAAVTVFDEAPPEELSDSVAALRDQEKVTLLLEGRKAEALLCCEVVFVNPAVRPTHPLVEQIRGRGIPLGSEAGLFLRLCPAPVIAVTGTSGKSTTCALIASMLAHAGSRCFLGGNIGLSLLNELPRITPRTPVVLELSSFQLHYLRWDCFRPPGASIAAITNVRDDHRNWHGSFENYLRSKCAILAPAATEKKAWAIVPGDDGLLLPPAAASGRLVCTVGTRSAVARNAVTGANTVTFYEEGSARELFSEEDLQGLGLCNLSNAAFAAAAAHLTGVPKEPIRRGIRAVRHLPHRGETVGVYRQVCFVNASVATTPQEAAFAVRSCPGPVILLAGGSTAKDLPFRALVAEARRRCRAAIVFGEAAEALSAAFAAEAPHVEAVLAETLPEAVAQSFRVARPGDTVLLAPGCPSFDAFVNFAARGECFTRCVKELSPGL